jgi:hypothetical protein
LEGHLDVAQNGLGATASTGAFGLAILGSLWDPGVKVQIGLIWLAVVLLVVITILGTAIKMAMAAPDWPGATFQERSPQLCRRQRSKEDRP